MDKAKEFPLAFAQRQLWFLEQLTLNGVGYNLLDAYHIQGALQVDVLKHCLSVMIERHGAFRTFFQDSSGQPVQVVAERIEWKLCQLDLRALPNSSREVEARKIVEAEVAHPFNLASPPLWRITLIQLDEQDCWLVFVVHHIIFDGRSSELFWHELLVLYNSVCHGHRGQLPEYPPQMTDFVFWQQQYLQGDVLDNLLSYWRQKLDSSLSPLELPTDFPRPAQPGDRGASLTISLPGTLAERLRLLSQRQQTTLFITCLAAFKVLLFRYTTQTTIAVGTPFTCRSKPELVNIIGFLVNTLVLKTELNEKQSFLNLLAQVRTTALEAYEHGELPFDLLVETLRPERDLSYNPLFQVMFVMPQRLSILPQNSTLTFSPLDLEPDTANFDLTLEVQETSTGIIASIEYNTDLFLPATISMMLNNYGVLLEAIVKNPQQTISRLSLLTSNECKQLLNIWSHTTTLVDKQQKALLSEHAALTLSLKTVGQEVIGELFQQGDLSKADAIATVLQQYLLQLQHIAANPTYSPPAQLDLKDAAVSHIKMHWSHLDSIANLDAPVKCLHQYFEDRVREVPDKIAVRHQSQQLTYRELNAAANQLAHLLIERGVQPDTVVGLCLARSIDMVVALLAVLKSGGAYLPLDPDYPPERLKYMVEDGQVPLVLTHSSLKPRLPNLSKSRAILYLDKDRTQIANKSQVNPTVAVEPGHLAYIIYTSGSTGKPKGVMIEHRAVSHFVQAAIVHYGITSSDCLLQFGSLSFDLAVEEIFTCLSSGARLQLRNDDMLVSPNIFLRSCQEWGITILDLPTAYWHQLVADIAPAQVQVPPTLRLIIIGGERVLPSLVKMWQQKVGDYPRLINSYGPTEATVVTTTFWITQVPTVRQDIPIGRPLPNSEVYVLDQYLQPVPIGTPGELLIGGHSLARGYLHRPDLTQLKFIPHPFSSEPGARLYKTGDRVRYLSDGNLEFLGRVDHQVKIRGFRIELGEIESTLLQYPDIREAAVVARADHSGYQQLIAYIVERPGQPISESTLRSFLKQNLPTYMVPATMITLEALPMTPNGKVDAQALPLPSLMSIPSHDTISIAPRTPLEDTLVKLWAEVLNLPKVGIRDGFFKLGGHSLQAVQLMTRIMSELDVELPLSALFNAPTVEEMSELLLQAGVQIPWSPLVPIQAKGAKPPFFAIHGGHGEVLFYEALAEQLGHDQPFYALRARGNDYPDMPHRQIEEMAACYIEAIRQVQPEGPYRIGGASFGGIVAFEMAQQLSAQGQITDPLVLFDTGGFGEFMQPLPLEQRTMNAVQFIFKYGLQETWKRLQLRILRLFTVESAVEFYRATGELPNRASPTLAIWESVWETNLEAVEQYTPKVYSGSVKLLRATDDGNFLWNDHQPDYGWGNYVQGGVTCYDLPGTHIGIFQAPNVEHLAQTLGQLLDRHPEAQKH